MGKYKQFFCISFLIICGICYLPINAEASNLEWTTTELFYELDSAGQVTNNLIIQGYFTNNTDQYVNWFYEVNFTAIIKSSIGAGYSRKISSTFRNFEKMIDPHSSAEYRFRIRKAEIVYPIDTYKVFPGYMRWKQSKAAG